MVKRDLETTTLYILVNAILEHLELDAKELVGGSDAGTDEKMAAEKLVTKLDKDILVKKIVAVEPKEIIK